MRVVVAGLAATYPMGGVGWDYLAYVDGFRGLGCEVVYLEDTGSWFYHPWAQTFSDDASPNLRYLQAALARIDAAEIAWAVRAPDGTVHGLDAAALTRACRDADLFLNVSGACWLRDEYRGARRTAYLDTDPGFTQSKLSAAARGEADQDQLFSVDLIRAHDCFFTFAEHIGRPDCRVPECGMQWHPTRQPVVLERWPMRPPPATGPWTTVTSWRIEPAAPRIDGVSYGGKDVELRRFMSLPSRVSLPLELALGGTAPRDEMRAQGWRVVEAYDRSRTMDDYQEYLNGSRGEWSIAKEVYVALRSGWFSTRSAFYLAAGRPVVVQDTGWSAHYPTGEGLHAFSTLDEAAAALTRVERDHARQCEAARAVAERELDASAVLTRLLHDAGV